MVLAACGLALSIAAHCIALAGVPTSRRRRLGTCTSGSSSSGSPTVLTSLRMDFAMPTGETSGRLFLLAALPGCVAPVTFFSATLFSTSFCSSRPLPVEPKQQQTGDAPPSVVRGFSGHWMIFYGVAFAVLYSRIHAPGLVSPAEVSTRDILFRRLLAFCPECGYAFLDATESADQSVSLRSPATRVGRRSLPQPTGSFVDGFVARESLAYNTSIPVPRRWLSYRSRWMFDSASIEIYRGGIRAASQSF